MAIKLVDLDDHLLTVVMFPRRLPGENPRSFRWGGKLFREDDTGFYDELTAVEVVSKEAA